MLSFRKFLAEKILSIGLNPRHNSFREKYRNSFHDILRNSYKGIGGYGGHGHGTKQESEAIHKDISDASFIKATKRNDTITHVSLYKDSHGRKLIAVGSNGTEQGKKDFYSTSKDDLKMKRSWGEVSGALEHIQTKSGFPKVKSLHAGKLLNKPVTRTGEYSYKRKIGDHDHEKVIMGFPKI